MTSFLLLWLICKFHFIIMNQCFLSHEGFFVKKTRLLYCMILIILPSNTVGLDFSRIGTNISSLLSLIVSLINFFISICLKWGSNNFINTSTTSNHRGHLEKSFPGPEEQRAHRLSSAGLQVGWQSIPPRVITRRASSTSPYAVYDTIHIAHEGGALRFLLIVNCGGKSRVEDTLQANFVSEPRMK